MFPIPKYVTDILEKLNNSGYDAYLAGGCVRDFLMNRIPSDYDVASSATPEEVKKCFEGMTVIETGIQHGTVTVVTGSGKAEITTFRIDGKYSDGRHPEKVMFSGNLEDDLKRRDFTVNAMAYNPKVGLVDLFGGKEHLKNKIICCVGSAEKRFLEDALRILRGLRFSSVLGFSIEKNTAHSITANKSLLKKISAERIFSEFKKLICGVNAGEVLEEYREVIFEFIPELSEISEEKYIFLCKNIGKCENSVNLRLAFLLSALKCENAAASLKRLKSDNKTIHFVKNTVRCLNEKIPCEKADIKRFMRQNSPEILSAVIKIGNITENNSMNKTERLMNTVISNNECFLTRHLAVNGNDVVAMSELKGAEIGKVLDCLLEAVIDEKIENKREVLTEYIKKIGSFGKKDIDKFFI